MLISLHTFIYAEYSLGNAQLIAYYTAALPTDTQIRLYSDFMETVTNPDARRICFNEGRSHGLDIQRIAFHTVDKTRHCNVLENVETISEQQIQIHDEKIINSLEWLTFSNDQISDLLWQANAMLRTFMAQNKTECMRKTFKMIPNDAIKQLIKFYGSKDNLPHREDCVIKEYFCHQAYLTAIDAYSYWSDCYYKQKPKAPTQLSSKPLGFTEKVAMEHQEQTYRSDLEKWQQKLDTHTQRCRDFLYNILLFPDRGWLLEDTIPNEIDEKEQRIWETRETQMLNLRKIVIPDVILLLYKILSLSGHHQECIKLVNEIANEERVLYKVYSKQRLTDFLLKVTETSLELMNDKKDPWGYDKN